MKMYLLALGLLAWMLSILMIEAYAVGLLLVRAIFTYILELSSWFLFLLAAFCCASEEKKKA